MDRETPDQLLSPSDAAKMLGLTPAGVVGLANRGALPCLRTEGGRRLFHRSDVLQLRDDRRQRRSDEGPAR